MRLILLLIIFRRSASSGVSLLSRSFNMDAGYQENVASLLDSLTQATGSRSIFHTRKTPLILLVARYRHLSGCFWLFALKFWEMAGTYEWWLCSKMNAARVGGVGGGRGTQPLFAANKNFELFESSGSGDAKTLSTNPCAIVNEPPGETFTT